MHTCSSQPCGGLIAEDESDLLCTNHEGDCKHRQTNEGVWNCQKCIHVAANLVVESVQEMDAKDRQADETTHTDNKKFLFFGLFNFW